MRHKIIKNVVPAPLSERQVATRFRKLVKSGFKLRAAGLAKHDPQRWLLWRYSPKYLIELFGARYYLSSVRSDNDFRFFVAYVLPGSERNRRRASAIYPRIFYKDASLIWRSATHYIRSEHEHWVGKGELKPVVENGREVWYSAEETTNLPFEIQAALDEVSRRTQRVAADARALSLVLRNAPDDRVAPYHDFREPRRRAMADPDQCINGNRPVAWFDDPTDPASLRFASGFGPDFDAGIIDHSDSWSRMYGGRITKYRILSANRKIQYMFIAAPAHVWIIPPQALTTEIMSYGLRCVDVEVDERLCIPGYEYHYIDDTLDPPELHTQIPPGFAGPPSELDAGRADASPWNDKMPVIREFRQRILRMSP